jgi:hypothetical protein
MWDKPRSGKRAKGEGNLAIDNVWWQIHCTNGKRLPRLDPRSNIIIMHVYL